jgi:hypothetical protein
MRTRHDLKILQFKLICGVTLDMERVENDPAWIMAGRNYDLADPLQMDAALVLYLQHYLAKEGLLAEMPSTNGPADVYGMECIGPNLAEQQATAARETLRAQLLAEADAAEGTPKMVLPTAKELYDRFSTDDCWGNCFTYPRNEWMAEVEEEDTILGYYDWLVKRVANDMGSLENDESAARVKAFNLEEFVVGSEV